MSDGLTEAIQIAGSEAKLARLTGYAQTAINKAKRAGKVSADMAIKIEAATGVHRGRIAPQYWTRPDKAAS